MDARDMELLKQAVEIARLARQHGNHPFGALLADAEGNVLLSAENTVVTERDCTGHAETNLMRLASRQFDPVSQPMHPLHQYRTLRNVFGGDLLGRRWARRFCIERGRVISDDRKRPGKPHFLPALS